MELTVILIIALVIIAVAFDFTNGFHDAANAIATVVATKALTMNQALAMAAGFNLLGAFVATGVAETIERGLIHEVDDPLTTQVVIISALLGAISWNVLTWFFGMPSSSSHAIVGGLVGAGLVYGHREEIIWSGVVNKVLIPMVTSPLVGLAIAGILMTILYLFIDGMRQDKRDRLFRKLQIAAGAFMAFSHGSNDAQKTMGVITMALIGANFLPSGSSIPWWVVLVCALAMAAGTYSGGRKIIETAGEKITKLNQESGFIANISGSITIFLASLLGMPVSTTHVVVGSITGAGLANARHQKSTASSGGVQGLVKSSGTAAIGEGMGEAIAIAEPELGLEDEPKQAINWSTWKNMATAWIFTLPGSALVGGLMYLVLSFLFIR
ncbi:MAG: inorganic phosphate transporter [Cyanobacteria bacterium J06592_8]